MTTFARVKMLSILRLNGCETWIYWVKGRKHPVIVHKRKDTGCPDNKTKNP
jgi:hypothetical protein